MGGASPYVYALAVSGSTLYAGGYFTSAGDDAGANNIAQWNGTSWSSLGSGMNSVVSALAVSGSTLYAGGVFTAAGDDTNANYIAAWDGKSWSSLDSGVNSSVSALAASGNTLYAAGYFTAVGAAATSANLVAEWNGSAWLPLGSGISGYYPEVSALAVSGPSLYVGGIFTNAGGILVNNLAQWNGSSWSALGSGLNGPVYALAAAGGTLYVGGDFSTAGPNLSDSAAEASIGGTAPVSPLFILTTNRLFGYIHGQFQFTVAGPVGSNAAVQASTNLRTWIPMMTNPLSFGSFNFTDMWATNYPVRFYRAQLAP